MQMKPAAYYPLIKNNHIGTKCSWFTRVLATNLNTGQEIDKCGCVVTWMLMLMIENTQQQRQTGAAVKSFHNEMIATQQDIHAVLLTTFKTINNSLMLETRP